MVDKKIQTIFHGGIREGDFLPKRDYFNSNLHKPLGRERIYIVNEASKICINHINEELKDNFFNLHGPLIGNDERIGDHTISIYTSEIDNFLKYPTEEYEFRRFLLDEDKKNIYFWTYHLGGYVEKQNWDANAYICSGQIRKALFILSDFILSYFSWWSIFQGGFIIHSASIIKDGKAYLFFGPPESGKTTICKLSSLLNLKIISDEYSMVLKSINGYRVYRPIQRKSLTILDDWSKGYPIAGIYRLAQAKEHTIEKLPKPIIISEILANLLFAHGYNVLGRKAMDNACDIVENIDYGKLHFRKDYYFWEVLEKNVPFRKNTD